MTGLVSVAGGVWQGLYQVVEGRHGKACLLEGDLAGLVSAGGGPAWVGLSVGVGFGKACLWRWRGGMAGLVCWREIWEGLYQVVDGRHGKACVCWRGVWQGMYHVVEGWHGRACLFEEVWQGLYQAVEGRHGKACVSWRGVCTERKGVGKSPHIGRALQY